VKSRTGAGRVEGASSARVLRIQDDGDVVVEAANGVEWTCELLETSPLAPLVLQAGERVLVLPPDATGERGIVLGRLGRARAGDGRVELAAKSELVLRCGKGKIVLRADGRVAITGLDIVSAAERRQRIKGGSVEIN
jgi:hypothetical protein